MNDFSINLRSKLFAFDEISNAGSFLSSIAVFAKFFEALIIPFGIVTAILILLNSNKKKMTLIPGCVLLTITLFNILCIIGAYSINNIEILDPVVSLLQYKNVPVNPVHPVIDPDSATISSALLSIPAIGFLTCGIFDIVYLKNHPEEEVKDPVDSKLKKARIFYAISAFSVLSLLLVASFISASFNVATINWIFEYFWQGYFLFVIAAIVFFVMGSNIAPIKMANKTKNSKREPVQVPVQQDSVVDELKKYKDLLDAEIITQEEFDAKKKQLLGL